MKTKIKNHVLIAFVTLALGAGVGATAALNGTVKAGAETVETTASANGMCFKTGAAVRTDSDSMGIRFEAYFNADIYAAVEAGTGAAGMIVVPAKAIEGVSDDYFEHLSTVHGKTAAEISTTFLLSQFTAEDYNADDAMDYLAKGAIVNVKNANLTYEYQAVAFYKAADGDYVYSGKSDVRTISEVTDIALKSDALTEEMRVDTLEMATVLSARLEGLNKSASSDFTLEASVADGIDLADYQSKEKTVVSATLDGEAVTVAENKIALTNANAKSAVQSLKLTYNDESTLIINTTVRDYVTVNVADTQKHELYASLDGDTRVANNALTFNAGTEIPAGLTWKANGVDVTENVTVSGASVTLDAVSAGLYGGEYTLVASGELNGTVTTVNANLLLVNKIITTAEDLLAWASYGDKTNVATFERTINLSSSKTGAEDSTKTYNQAYTLNGYFELGADIDLTGKNVNAFAYFTADTGSGANTAYGLKGTFDGKGYTVYGGTYYEGGLFGAVATGSTVKNLALSNITMNSTTSDYYLGVRPSAFAETVSGTISNVLVDVIGYAWPHCQVATGFSYNLIDATLENVVVYYPFIQEASAIMSYQGSNVSISNVYAIGADNDYRFQAWGYIPGAANPTTIKLSQVDMATSFTGLDASLWNLNLNKPYFANYAKTLADFDDEISTIPTEVKEGETVTLPTLSAYATYSLGETTAASLSSNILTVSNTLEADTTLTLTVNLSAYGVENKTVEIAVQNLNYVVVEGVQKYEVYPTLDDSGVKVANATPFTVSLGAGVPDEGMTWTATDSDNVSKDATAYVSVLDGVATIDPALRGEYKLVGKNADESVSVEMNVLIVNKFISEATQLQNIKAYGDISDEGTLDNLPQYKFDGYFVLTKNLDMTDLTMTVSFTTNIADVPTNKQNEYGFIGTLDGDGYTVSSGTYSTGGLFGSVGSAGTIKNIAFVNASLAYNCSVIAANFYGTLENVLIDFVLPNNTIGKGIASGWILNATLKNVVVYAPTNATVADQYTYAAFIPYKHASYGNMDPSTFTNCYSFTNNTAGDAYGITSSMFGTDANNVKNIQRYALSNNASVITGMDTTLWNLTSAKATFIAKADKA